MLVSASALDDKAAMAVFRRHILSVHGIATDWFEDKVVRACAVVVLVGGSFEVDAEPVVVVDKFFGSVGVSIPTHRLVWCLRLLFLQRPLDFHCDTL